MEISITYQSGPIEAEIAANEDEEFDEVLEKLSSIVEEHPANPVQTGQSSENEPTTYPSGAEHTYTEEDKLSEQNPLSDLNDIPDDDLYRFLKIGKVESGDVKEHPRIIGDTDLLGDTNPEKILNASIILLSVFEDFHGLERAKSSDLKQCLEDSGLPIDNYTRDLDKNDNAEIYLNRRGRGPSATTEIRPPGKDAAYEFLTESVIKA